MNKKNLICIILLILIIGIYYRYQIDDSASIASSNTNSPDTPIYQSDDMITNVYDLSGSMVYKIESSKVRHFDNTESTDSQLQQVLTDNAVVDLKTQLVTSEDQVKIKGIGFFSMGIGLIGDLREKTANILENIKTFYNTEVQ